MHAREELSHVGECRLDLLSLKDYIDPDQILGKSVTLAVDTDGDAALLQRLRDAVLAGRPVRHATGATTRR